MRYLSYIGAALVDGTMYLLAFIFWGISFTFRKQLRAKESRNWFQQFLWWFLNDTTAGRDAGDYGRFEHNLIGAIQQNLFRNSHWNFRINVFVPNKGAIENLSKGGRLTFYRLPDEGQEPVFGTQNITYDIEGQKLFRYSFLKQGKWLWFTGVHQTYFCLQLGAANHRYLYKFRLRKVK
jgi:hypothetical protein